MNYASKKFHEKIFFKISGTVRLQSQLYEIIQNIFAVPPASPMYHSFMKFNKDGQDVHNLYHYILLILFIPPLAD
jgi:hypothetical protein